MSLFGKSNTDSPFRKSTTFTKGSNDLFKVNEGVGDIFNTATETPFARKPKKEIFVVNRASVSTKYLIDEKDNTVWGVAELITTGLQKIVNGIKSPINLFSDLGLTDVKQLKDTNSEVSKLFATINSPAQIVRNAGKRDYRFGLYFLDAENKFIVPTMNGEDITTRIEIPAINQGKPFVILDIMQYPDARIDLRRVVRIFTLTPATSLAAISPSDIQTN